MPIGVVVRRSPGVTAWAKWSWKAVAVLPGAAPARWKVLRDEDGIREYHAATLTLELHGAESEAYLSGLADKVPAIYVVMRPTDDTEQPFHLLLATASPYEGQDYADNGDDIVEKVPMPDGLIAWVRDFADKFYQEEVFVKRRRDKKRVDIVEDGFGDPRIAKPSDVYRAPKRREPAA
ncbi:MAG: DUF3305 domain-containing protein [Pseudomonadota bacterium]